MTVPAPDLRVVSDALSSAVHERLAEVRVAYLRGTNGKLWGRPERTTDSKYLLTGLARCATCNGSLFVKSRSHGRKRAYFYGCSSFHKRGACVCPNSVEVPMDCSDDAVLSVIERQVLQPEIVSSAIRKAVARLKRHAAANIAGQDQDTTSTQLAAVERELAHLTAAVSAGGELRTLIQAIREREGQRDILRRKDCNAGGCEACLRIDPDAVERALTVKLKDWRALLRRHVPQARQILRKLLGKNRLEFKAYRNGRERGYEFRDSSYSADC
jgi:recombinase-like zinc beta ribbon protein